MRWMIEEARLGEDQREIIEEVIKTTDRPIWIQGHAGSGKSVVLIHALSDYLIRNPMANVVVVVFTRALVDLIKTGMQQIPSLENRNVDVITIYQLDYRLNKGSSYDAIFCDEVQDLPVDLLKEMNNSCKKLVIAGDAAQSIYGFLPKWASKPASSEEIDGSISPVKKNSSTIYRLTKSVIKALKNVFPDLEKNKTYEAGIDSEIRLLYSKENFDLTEETEFGWNEIENDNRLRPEDVSAILIYKREDIVFYCQQILKLNDKEPWSEAKVTKFNKEDYDLEDLNNHLRSNNVPIMYVGNGVGSLKQADEENKIIIMTYHSAKGLDFDTVLLPYISTDLGSTSNENALILVSLSRAKRELLITYTGEIYSAFKLFLNGITPVDIAKENDGEILF